MRKRHSKLATAIAALAPFAAIGAAGADVTTPAGLNPGDHFNLIFISSTTTAATSSDPAYYDGLVSTEAAANGLDTYSLAPVKWEALGSFFGGPDAISRFDPNSPIYLLDGTKVADNGAGLWSGSLLNPIDVYSNGLTTSTPTNGFVWTGTGADGTAAIDTNLDSKALGAPKGSEYGMEPNTDASWTQDSSFLQEPTYSLYAFSNELTVPGNTSSVPLPSSGGLALAGAALAALSIARQRRIKTWQ